MLLEEISSRHIQRVISVAHNKVPAANPEPKIIRSWERCLESYGLDPASNREPFVVERAELTNHRDRLIDALGEVTKAEMEQLYQRIAGSGYSVILTNSEGVILNYIGDPTLSDHFQRAGLLPGAIWSEHQEGTNGIGTCLYEQTPVTIYRDEHFCSRHIQLTCSAAPIFDIHGSLLGVLDVSSVNALDSRQIHQHTDALVTLSAKQIEHFGFLHHCQRYWVLRFHQRTEYIGHWSEAIIAMNEGGQIVATNQNALKFLGMAHRKDLIGRHIGEIFTTNLSLLLNQANREPNSFFNLQETMQGKPYIASIRLPQRVVRVSTLAKPLTTPIMQAAQHPADAMSLLGLAGKDPRMAYNVHYVQRVVNKKIPILLQGETGTGKEVFAKAIHHASERASKPFVALNCAAIPESLIESELFGYKHGAFTGARREGMRGKILQSNGGTLFLDEIGDMPPQLQTRLLRVLEEKEVLPLGCEVPIPVDLNIISATHRNLHQLIEQDVFREDLYYRLNGVSLTLPALRERSDKEDLIRRMLSAENMEEGLIEIEADAFQMLLNFPWQGNIRQLRNVIRTALALCSGGVLRVGDFPSEISQQQFRHSPANYQMPPTLSIASPVEQLTHDNVLDSAERTAIMQELERFRWNITNTASSLKMSRNTLYRKMKKHGIALPSVG